MRFLLPLFLLHATCLSAQEASFVDASLEAGIDATGRGRGVSVCDYNGDGYPDLFLCFLDGPNLLYRNDGTGHFTETGHGTPLADAGPAMTALWGDFDNDGDQDVLVGNSGEASRLFRNDAGTFTDITASSGIVLKARVQAGSLLDYDGDGLSDIYLSCLNAPNRLYRNLGNLQFEERGGDAGAAQTGLGMGTLAFDYDRDGDPDLYLVHDGNQANVLLRNDGGTFTDVSEASGTGLIGDGMGVDAADYDGDGDFDLYVTNLYENFLLQNQGDGTFREVAFDAGVNDIGMGWGTAWMDYDNDGRPDLYVANETNFEVGGKRLGNVLYHNGETTFLSAAAPDAEINSGRSSYGTATADFNGDGRPDLFVANSGQASQLFLNATKNNNGWAAFALRPASGNRDALGALVTVYLPADTLIAELRAGGSFASQHDRTLHFGLGRAGKIDSVQVCWPSGDTTTYFDLEPDRLHILTESAAATTAVTAPAMERIGIHPNPSSGEIYLSTPLRRVRIFDGLGRCVLSLPGPTDHLLLPGGLPSGLYRIIGEGGEAVYTGTIQHHTY